MTPPIAISPLSTARSVNEVANGVSDEARRLHSCGCEEIALPMLQRAMLLRAAGIELLLLAQEQINQR